MVKILSTVLALALIWWVITDGALSSWILGVPVLAMAVWASLRLNASSDAQISLSGLLRFLPFFLWESLRGGVDVARRTLAPALHVEPDFIRYRSRLPSQAARAFFANCVSLLPGTLVADIKDEWLEVHVLNSDSDAEGDLRRLEQVVARVFPASEGAV